MVTHANFSGLQHHNVGVASMQTSYNVQNFGAILTQHNSGVKQVII